MCILPLVSKRLTCFWKDDELRAVFSAPPTVLNHCIQILADDIEITVQQAGKLMRVFPASQAISCYDG